MELAGAHPVELAEAFPVELAEALPVELAELGEGPGLVQHLETVLI